MRARIYILCMHTTRVVHNKLRVVVLDYARSMHNIIILYMYIYILVTTRVVSICIYYMHAPTRVL